MHGKVDAILFLIIVVATVVNMKTYVVAPPGGRQLGGEGGNFAGDDNRENADILASTWGRTLIKVS